MPVYETEETEEEELERDEQSQEFQEAEAFEEELTEVLPTLDPITREDSDYLYKGG